MFIERKINNSKNSSDFLQIIVTSFVALTCLALTSVFPVSSGFQEITKNLFFLVIIPALFIKYVLKKDLRDFGFNIKDKKAGLIWGGIMTITALVIAYILVNYSPFPKNYALPATAINNFWYFLVYELLFVNFFLFIYEFFFRGFILFYLSRQINWWAVPVEIAIYCLLLIFIKNFSWNMAPMIILSAASAITAIKSRSFVFSYASGMIFMIILDAYLIHSIK